MTALVLLLIVATTYTCYRTVMGDPGYVPLPELNEARQTIIGLADRDQLTHRHFCASCLVCGTPGEKRKQGSGV